ncbi:MAG: hypothetical protein WCA24_09310 [Thiomonas sp.]
MSWLSLRSAARPLARRLTSLAKARQALDRAGIELVSAEAGALR